MSMVHQHCISASFFGMMMMWKLSGWIEGPSANHAEARLYDEDIGPMKFAGLDKFGRPRVITVNRESLEEDLKKVYKDMVGPMVTEINRPIKPFAHLINAYKSNQD